jgi:hypothetical protein
MLSRLGENCGELWITAPALIDILLLRNNLSDFFHVDGTAELGVLLTFPHSSK